MQNQNSVFEKPSKVNLFLVEPNPTLSFQFSALRHELKSNNIPYQTLIGFDKVKELMPDKVNKNLIIVNSLNLRPQDIPKEIFNLNNNEIYFYPKSFDDYNSMNKPEIVCQQYYRKCTNTLPPGKKITLRSVKKDIERSNEKWEGELYKKILVMYPRGADSQYSQLFNVLQNYQKVATINNENNVQSHRDYKSLLILQRESFENINKFINSNRLQTKIDIAVLGYPKILGKSKNCVIMTEYPIQIIDYIAESGTELKGARQKLSLYRGSLGSGFHNSTDQNTGVFLNEEGAQLSFNPTNKTTRQGQFMTFGNQANLNVKLMREEGETVTYNTQLNKKLNAQEGQNVEYEPYNKKMDFQEGETVSYSNHIPITSKISEASNNQKSKKPQIKKIKKMEANTSGISSALRENDEVPAININTVHSQASENGKIELEKEMISANTKQDKINLTKSKSKKLIMDWDLFPDLKAGLQPRGNMPKFILKSAKGEIFECSQNKNQKPRMDWKLSPDRSRKSQFLQGRPFFNLYNQKQNIGNKEEQVFISSPESKKQIGLPIASQQSPKSKYPTTPYSQPTVLYAPSSPQFSSIKNQQSNKISEERQKQVMHWSVYPDKNQSSPYRKGPYYIINLIPSNKPAKAVAYAKQPQTMEPESKESIAQESSQNSAQGLGYQPQNKVVQLIEQKYNLGNEIKQLSEQYRGSYVSHQLDQNSQRITINSNHSPYIEGPKRSNSQKDPPNVFESNGSGKKMMKSEFDNRNLSSEYENRIAYSVPAIPYTSDRPMSRVVRQEPRAAETYYMEPSQKKIEESRRQPITTTSMNGITQSTNKSSAVSPLATTTSNSFSYSYTNPYSLNAIANTNVSSNNSQTGQITTVEPVNRRKESSSTTNAYGSTYAGNSPTNGKPNGNIISGSATTVTNPIYADINRTIASTYYGTNSNSIGNSTSPTSRAAYSNSNVPNPYAKETPSNSSLNKDSRNWMANLGIDQSKYDIITDENGVRRYRLKENRVIQANSRISANPQTYQTADTRIASPRNVVQNSPAINTIHTINTSNTIGSTKNVFNFNDYDENIDERGNKYYTVKKAITKVDPPQTGFTTPRPSQTLLIESKKRQPINSPIQHRATQRQSSELSQGKYQRTRYSEQLPATPSNAGTKSIYEPKIITDKKQFLFQAGNSRAQGSSSLNTNKIYANSAKELEKNQPASNMVNFAAQEYKGIEVGVSKPVVDYNQNRFSQYSNQVSQVSRMTPDSQLTDSKSSSMYKFNAHLYGQTKPYSTSVANMRVESVGELEKVMEEFKTLKTSNNFTHYIIDTSHPLRYEIEQLADVQDKIVEVDYPEKIYDYMLKKPLPNQYYDIGFIFINSKNINKINSSEIVEGYYLIDINDSNIPIEVKKQKKRVSISDLRNLALAKKLLLAPNIQHFVFYPRSSEGEISTMLSLFPSSKFNKFGYNNRSELQSLFQTHLRNKGRLTRTLIFVNLNNLNEIAPLMDHALNHKTFTMICNTKHSVDDKLKKQYKRVTFQNNFDFGSYGSVISLANKSNIELNNTDRLEEEESKKIQSNDERPKIYIQHPHKGIDHDIEKALPNAYDIKFFMKPSEIKDRSRDNFILLHRQADNVGSQFDRNIGTLILLGGKKGDRSPSGTVTIQTVSELIEEIL